MHSDEALRSLLRAHCWRRACVCRGYSSWSGRVSRPVGRSLAVSGVDCISGEWNPRRGDLGAVCYHGNNVSCRTAHAAMVVAARLVHYWTRGDGGVGASASEFVSFPCDLDIATLDTRYGTGVADAVGGVGSHDWDRSPISAQIECSAMGARAFAHVVVACVPPYFRGGSESRDGSVLRRSNIWCVCDAAPNIDLGARARRARICDGIHSLFARSKRLSNVGPASAGGSVWPDRQRRQTFPKEECV